MSITSRNCSGVSRVAGTAVPLPALLTSTSTCSELRHGRFDCRSRVPGSRHVRGYHERAPTALLDQCRAKSDTEPCGDAGDNRHLSIDAEAVEHRGRRHLWSSRQRADYSSNSSCKLLLVG